MDSEKKLRFIKSERGGILGVINFRMFHLLRVDPLTNTAYFECVERKKIQCKARVIAYNFNRKLCTFSSFKETNEHRDICYPKPEKLLRKEVHNRAKEIVKGDVNVKTSDIIKLARTEVIKEPEMNTAVGKLSHISRLVCRAKREATGERQIGTNRVDFVLPEDLQLTESGSRFLLKDIPGGQRQLMFASDEMLKKLAVCDVWFVDGTFKMSPSWFTQLFTVHGLYMKTCVPMVYALLPGKRQTHYEEVFSSILSSRAAHFQPEYIICDFELAIINACKQVFPASQVSGCLFHLCQSLYRRVQHEKLTYKYENDTKFRIAVKSLAALAFCPPGDVYSRFCSLKFKYESNSDERKIMTYFHENYIGLDNVSFPIPFWNCYDRLLGNIPRTNNAVEGWHYKMNKNLTGSHPTLWTCIQMLKNEQQSWEVQISSLRTGLGESQRKCYQALDNRLKLICEGYNRQMEDLEFLQAISECIYDYIK